MRKHAALKDLIVTQILEIDETSYAEHASKFDMLIDIEDMLPQPQIGHKLEGNELVPNHVLNAEDQDLVQQTTQRLQGLRLIPSITDKIGARNLKLSREGTPVDVALLASQMASVKILLEGGALKTVRGLCSMMKASHPNHADILDDLINEITSFLNTQGY